MQSKIIVQGLTDGIGNDYCAASLLLLSFAKIPDLEQKLKDGWDKEFQFIWDTVRDVLILVAIMLAYNCMINNLPKDECDGEEASVQGP